MDTPNEPMALPGVGTGGTRRNELRQRSSMKQLLINGLSDDELCTAMQGEFGLSDEEAMELKAAVQARLVAESDERKPAKKAMSEQRIHRHILSASKKNQWGAVANLEAALARIQGTEEPVEQRLQIDQRITSATMHVLSGMSQDEVERLIASELQQSPRLLAPETSAPVKVIKPRIARP